MIEIAYAVHDHFGNYHAYLGISMLSLMENTKEALRFHILCDDTLTAEARCTLSAMCARFSQKIVFHDMTPDPRIPIAELLKSGYNEGILYRLYLPELMPEVKKVLYLDADLLAHGDIRALWNVELGDCAAAGRWDPPLMGFKLTDMATRQKCLPFWEQMDWNTYINSGVLVLNLDKIRREHRLMEEALAFWEEFGWAFPDQDAINYILRGKIRLLPPHLNLFPQDIQEVREGYFYHYGFQNGLSDVFGPIDKLYLSYWEKSPFYQPMYEKKEKARFLRLVKNRADVYLRLEQIQPLDMERALYCGAALLERGMLEEAYQYLTEDLMLPRPLPDGAGEHWKRDWRASRCYYRALCLERMGRKAEAIALLREELTRFPAGGYSQQEISAMELRYLAGRLCYEEGRYDEAISHFGECLYFGTGKKNLLAVWALRYLVKCSIRMGDFAAAETYNNMVLTLNPLDEGAKMNRLRIAYGMRNR